ncbi:Cmg1p [Lachancea thermotolerans CBS 6340]|uniref:KLTH0G15466p n=1 Tax=Lachancea thermotolerans (strain ATCC 56472 / CBS 6340 / NRRL Y-8284) TaxID=559295 RepID=C5DNA7_LACTC|nr:KLTH0G15466p [Lachancea thermotolerans CBS 6340]CAR25268.1 KLTH0G15466p [Lachancea thermotolerans CBS 6340]
MKRELAESDNDEKPPLPPKRARPLSSAERQERQSDAESSEEPDYLTMALPDEVPEHEFPGPEGPKAPSSDFPGPKKDHAHQKAAALMPKGFAMMNKMGFKMGGALGKGSGTAITEPIAVARNTKRQGIKRTSSLISLDEPSLEDVTSYRKRVQDNGGRARKARVLHRMQKTAFELSGDIERFTVDSDPRDYNCLWREYVVELKRKLKPKTSEEAPHLHELSTSVSKKLEEEVEANSSDSSSPEATPSASASASPGPTIAKTTGSSEDDELAIFQELPLDQQITGINIHLRVELNYCFYCGVQFESEKDLFEHCPGSTEEDHQ